MATQFTFTCLHCREESQSRANNAKFCLKPECQKARMDVNRQTYKDRKKTGEGKTEKAKSVVKQTDKNMEKNFVSSVGKTGLDKRQFTIDYDAPAYERHGDRVIIRTFGKKEQKVV